MYKKDAKISDCGKYRYKLSRSIEKPCLFIMLNPSTANALDDDPTVRKCLHYMKRLGCSRMVIVNLFGYRATNPDDLISINEKEAAGIDNGGWLVTELEQTFLKGGEVVIAWGSHRAVNIGGKSEKILRLLKAMCIKPLCLAINKDGNPKHPLYCPNDAKFLDYFAEKDRMLEEKRLTQ